MLVITRGYMQLHVAHPPRCEMYMMSPHLSTKHDSAAHEVLSLSDPRSHHFYQWNGLHYDWMYHAATHKPQTPKNAIPCKDTCLVKSLAQFVKPTKKNTIWLGAWGWELHQNLHLWWQSPFQSLHVGVSVCGSTEETPRRKPQIPPKGSEDISNTI